MSEGITIKLFISVTKDTVNIEPIELLKWVKDLGVQEMALERLTGNAMPTYILKFSQQILNKTSGF